MNPFQRCVGISLVSSVGLLACGGGGSGETPLNTDYSTLTLAQSTEARLQYARNERELLEPLRNGLRLMLAGSPSPDTAWPAATSVLAPFSGTTVQIEGVEEADTVKYDGHYIYSARPEEMLPTSSPQQVMRNVLSIARTDPIAATVEPVARFVIEGQQNGAPSLYVLPAAAGGTEYVAAVSQSIQAWLLPINPLIALVPQPDRTTVQLLDVRDPMNVSQAWKLEIDGWLSASRMIGDTLYLVNSYRPRVPDLVLPADTLQKREANERLIRSSTAAALLPSYAINDGTRHALVTPDRCLVIEQLRSGESYTDLVVISAIDLRTRNIVSSTCLSTNVNAVYMSRDSLYVAGRGTRSAGNMPITVLHKFALGGGNVVYRAIGGVDGSLGWSNPSYFMDEHAGNLRLLTTTDGNVHHLSILRESAGVLSRVSTLPNAARPGAIGKPGESVYAVRFTGERAYVVTFRMTDPLYVIDLHDPLDPAIAGSLEIPGFGTYLRALGPTQSEALLSIGQAVNTQGRREGVKVELFDVRDIAHPMSVGSAVIGRFGTWSDALNDPHAITFLEVPGPGAGLRMGLPIHVYDAPGEERPDQAMWTYSGLHLFEISNVATEAPQLHFQGVIRTSQYGAATLLPTFALPQRGVMHGDAVFAISGEDYLASRWEDL